MMMVVEGRKKGEKWKVEGVLYRPCERTTKVSCHDNKRRNIEHRSYSTSVTHLLPLRGGTYQKYRSTLGGLDT